MQVGSDAHDPNVVVFLRRVAWISGIVVATAGCVVLLGWVFDWRVAKSIHPALASMKANTAVGFLFIGLALLFRQQDVPAPWHRKAAIGLAGLVVTLGGVTLAEYATGKSVGIDQALFTDNDPWASSSPGRMSPASALNFVLLGLALLLFDVHVRRKEKRPAEWLALVAALISLISLLGYLYGVRALYALGPFSSIAIHTTVVFLFASTAVLFARPDQGITQFLASDSPGGVLARHLLPAALIAPALLGWIRLKGQEAGLYGTEAGLALFAMSNVVCFTGLVWWNAGALTRSDSERRRAESVVRESEDDLSITLDSIGDAVIATDATGRVTRMNPVAERLTGWSLTEARGLELGQVFRILNEKTRQPAENPVDRVIREGIVVGLADHAVLISRDGTSRPIADSGAPIRTPVGALRGVVLVFRDMTRERRESAARQRAEDALKEKEDQLRQAQKMEAIGQLAGGVAHDFNNLLSVILSYSDLLSEEFRPGDPRRDELQEVRKAGERATALTQQLLAFSRKQVLQPRVLNLDPLVGGMEKMLKRLVGEDIEFSIHLPDELGRVYADPGQVEQVLMNLVVNARDAMPRGGKITIEAADVNLDVAYAAQHLGVTAGPHVMLAVSDTGHGMDRETQRRIFEPFFTTKDQGKGTGLGLSTVFGIVKQSKGHIWVYSEPGQGTTFKLYFPRSDGTVESLKAEQSTPAILRGSETILVVEDEEQVRVLLRSILRRQGYNVLEAQNGGEAFLICEKFSATIHLLVTDVVMPHLSGRQLADRLAPIKPEMKVLYVSGYTENSIVHHGVLDAGIAFLQKPITPDPLIRKVREVLDQPRPAK